MCVCVCMCDSLHVIKIHIRGSYITLCIIQIIYFYIYCIFSLTRWAYLLSNSDKHLNSSNNPHFQHYFLYNQSTKIVKQFQRITSVFKDAVVSYYFIKLANK